MIDENRIESIEKYLEGNMTEKERSAFEQQLQTDSILAAEVQQHRIAGEAIRYANQKDLKDRLRSIDLEERKPKPKPWYLRQLAIAASVLILVFAGVYLFNSLDSNKDPRLSMSSEEIAIEFYSPATNSQMRSDANTGTPTFSDRLSAADSIFESGNYREAANAYASLAKEQNPQSQKADWNMLLSEMAAGDAGFRTDLNRVASDQTHLFHNKAVELKSILAAK